MPGKNDVVVSIGEKDIVLKPLVGMRSMIVFPKVIGVVTKIVYAAGKADIDLRGIFGGDDFDWSKFKFSDLLAVPYVAETIASLWPEISTQIMPQLLGESAEFLLNNGSPNEHFIAIWEALKFHAPTVFGEDTWSGLKKLLEEEEEEPEAEESAEPKTTSVSSEA